MADPRFFTPAAPQSLHAIVALTGCDVHPASADISCAFSDVAPLNTATARHISFLDNPKYADAFAASQAGACFVRAKFIPRAPQKMVLLITENPYAAFALSTRIFHPEPAMEPYISPRAFIDPSAQIGENCRIEDGCSIGANVIIGESCHIGVNAVIGQGVTIGAHSRIGALSSISHSIIGDHVIIHRGAHIGQDGFGFAPSAKGIIKVPQIGRVLIGDHVEIGSGTCIDRGAGPDTVIGAHTKIDNLVQIGHNCQIGSYVFIAGQAGISGSTKIEDGAQLGGQSGVSGHVTIGKGAKIAAQAGVMTDVPDGATYGGFPAIPIREWHRQTGFLKKAAKKKDA